MQKKKKQRRTHKENSKLNEETHTHRDEPQRLGRHSQSGGVKRPIPSSNRPTQGTQLHSRTPFDFDPTQNDLELLIKTKKNKQ